MNSNILLLPWLCIVETESVIAERKSYQFPWQLLPFPTAVEALDFWSPWMKNCRRGFMEKYVAPSNIDSYSNYFYSELIKSKLKPY